MRKHLRREWITVGMLAAGAILLAACSGSAQSDEPAQADQQPTTSTVTTPAEDPVDPGEMVDDSLTGTEPTSGVTEQESSFVVQDALTRFGYPVETSSVLSEITGDIPADQYSVTWSFDFSPNLEGEINLNRRYRLNPNVDLLDGATSPDSSRWICIERDDGYGKTCTGTQNGVTISLDGRYEVYTQEFGPGGFSDPLEGTKQSLGSFVYTAPKYQEPLKPALCELTGGNATLEGEDFVITVSHTGECSSAQTWLGNVHGVINGPDTPPNFLPPLNVLEVSHDESTTVLQIPVDAFGPVLDYIDGDLGDINAFQVMSGSIEPGYEASTVRIDVQQ